MLNACLSDQMCFVSNLLVDNFSTNLSFSVFFSCENSRFSGYSFLCSRTFIGLGVLGVEAAGVGFSDRQNNLRLLWHTNPQYVTEVSFSLI